MSDYKDLADRIRTGLRDVNKCVERVAYLKDKALRSGDDGFWDGVALNLHGFDSGVERVFEDIARTIENKLPSGAEWHSDLLTQMAGSCGSQCLHIQFKSCPSCGISQQFIGMFPGGSK